MRRDKREMTECYCCGRPIFVESSGNATCGGCIADERVRQNELRPEDY